MGPNPPAGVLTRGDEVTQRETPGAHAHRQKAIWRHSKEVAICEPRREASGETKPANTLILNFEPPEPTEINLLFKPSSLQSFVMAAPAN